MYYDNAQTMSITDPATTQSFPTTASAAAPTRANGEFLWRAWYPGLRSNLLPGKRLRRATLLEVPLVLGRDATGKPFALRDVCPHRAFPLSFGQFNAKPSNETLECAYHGWQFDVHSGQCRHIPSLTPDSKLKCERIFAGSYPCAEKDGYIWVFMNNAEGRSTEEALPALPALPTFSEKFQTAHLSSMLPCNVDHGIIGLMDPAHGPFVHQAWWWRSRRSIREKAKQYEPIANGFRMSPHAPSANSAPYKIFKFLTGEPATTTIDFVLPNVRFEVIRAGKYWLASRTTVTPLTREMCRLDFFAAWNILPLVPIVPLIIHVLGPRFIRQDVEVIQKQAIGLRHQERMMLIDDADRPARWYFELKAAFLDAQRRGASADVVVESPLAGPVTLRWRS